MGKFDGVSDEELIARLRDGETAIEDYLMEKYKGLVRQKARAMFLIGGDTDDLIQEGMIGLFKAVRDFQPDKEASFATFARVCIDRQMYSAIQNSNRQKHQPLNSYVSLNQDDESIPAWGLRAENPEAIIIDQETTQDLRQRISDYLSPMENKVLDLYLKGTGYVEIAGILNGTTNYMMTRMFYEGANYEEVLREAQKNGFAEADPTADVEGQDACRKIAILASIISGKYVDFEEIYTEGITKITTEDMQYAKALGMNIKLLAECKHVDGTLYAGVAPVLLHAEHPLYSVNGVFNAVFVKGNMLGDAMFYGSGAGKLPTASAVVADIVAVVQNQGRDIMNFWSEEKLTLEDRSKTSKKFLVRIRGNVDAFKERIGNDFGEVRFVEAGVNGEFGFVTPVMTEGEYEEKAKAYPEILHMIRVEEEV